MLNLPPPTSPHGWRTNAVAAACGVTKRQLQWWDENGYISPFLVHHTRYFNRREIYKVWAFSRLLQSGMPRSLSKRVFLAWCESHVNTERDHANLAVWAVVQVSGRSETISFQSGTDLRFRPVGSLHLWIVWLGHPATLQRDELPPKLETGHAAPAEPARAAAH